jgi:hypothetical protein
LAHGNATQPEGVAKKILQAISVEKPEFRYIIGKDAVCLFEARKNMPFKRVPKDDNAKYRRVVQYIIKT